MPDDNIYAYQKRRRRQLEETEVPQILDWQCAYVTRNGIRCREIGGISDSTTGRGPYYCRDHYREKGTIFADQVAEFTYKYTPQAKPSWRDELVAQRQRELGLPDRMKFEDFRQRVGNCLLGKMIVEQVEANHD